MHGTFVYLIFETTDWTSNENCNYETYFTLLRWILCTIRMNVTYPQKVHNFRRYAVKKVKMVNTENTLKVLVFALSNLDFNRHFELQHFDRKENITFNPNRKGNSKYIELQVLFPNKMLIQLTKLQRKLHKILWKFTKLSDLRF